VTENIDLPRWPGVRHATYDPTLEKTLVTKSEEGVAGWKYLRGSGKCLKDLKM
jgi:hypothetical protein